MQVDRKCNSEDQGWRLGVYYPEPGAKMEILVPKEGETCP